MRLIGHFVCVFVLSHALCVFSASAQEMSAQSRAQAVDELRGLAACVHEQDAALDHILQLLAEAEEQAESSDTRLQQAAYESVEALIGQANEVQRELRSCIRSGLANTGDVTIRETTRSDQSPRVETRNSITVIDHDRALGTHVHVINAERVDGRGRVDPARIRQAIDRIAPSLDQCTPRRGHTVDLVFTITASGQTRGIMTEGQAPRGLAQCVERAGRRLRVRATPTEGNVTYSYTLRFGE